MKKNILVMVVVLMLLISLLSGCADEEKVEPEPEPEPEPLDSDGDGFPDELDAFPDDPELHEIKYIEIERLTLDPGDDKTIYFTTEEEEKYVVLYWDIEPFTDEAGETIAFRFKTQEGWQSKKHRGKTNQVKETITESKRGDWAVWIKHDNIVTGYETSIIVEYRIFVLI